MKCSRCNEKIKDEEYRSWLVTTKNPDFLYMLHCQKTFAFCNKCKKEFDSWLEKDSFQTGMKHD